MKTFVIDVDVRGHRFECERHADTARAALTIFRQDATRLGWLYSETIRATGIRELGGRSELRGVS